MYRTDVFDHTSPDVQGPKFWDALRTLQERGPLTWVESNGGFWAATSYDVVLQIVQDWDSFTSTEGVAIGRPSFDDLPRFIPIELDPPRQRVYRKLVNPHLTINATSHLEEPIRDIANEIIDTFIDQGSCDIAVDFARKFPGMVFFRLIVDSDDDDFRTVEPSARVISFESNQPERFAEAAANLRGWAQRVLEDRAACPHGGDRVDDVVDAVRSLGDDDETFADIERYGGLQLLAQGGIGTSASVLGVIMRVLGEDLELQQQVVDDRSLIPRLIEECLRLEPPLPLIFRTATRDLKLAGQQVRDGDKVGVFFGAANRDPGVFERPDDVRMDRPHYRHLAFGGGVHRCIGSNVARLQLRVAVEQLIDRLCPFRIPDGAEIQYFSLQARGPASVPIEFATAGQPSPA